MSSQGKSHGISGVFITLVMITMVILAIIMTPYAYDTFKSASVRETTYIPGSTKTFNTIDPTLLEDTQKDNKNPLEGIAPDEDEDYVGELQSELDYYSDKTKKSESVTSTETPTISLESANDDGLIGSSGLMPGTSIAIIKKKEGDRIFYDSCTIAFSLQSKKGDPWAVTAGHCGSPGQEVYSVPGKNKTAISKLGTVRISSKSRYVEGANSKNAGDWALISLNPNAKLPSYPDFIPNVLNLQDIKIGDKLCKYGSTTGYDCGKKSKEGVIVASKGNNGEKLTALQDEATMCSLPGDSGAPVFDRIGIVGILVASNISGVQANDTEGKCNDRNHRAYYVPISDVIKEIRSRTKTIDI